MQTTAEYLGVSTRAIRQWNEEGLPLIDDAADAEQRRALSRWLANRLDHCDQSERVTFSQWTLDYGFVAGITLSFFTFAALVTYLFLFLRDGGEVPGSKAHPQLLSEVTFIAAYLPIKLKLLSCGLMAGAALAFLGLSLFLIGVRGSMTADASGASYQTKLVNIAPGTLVILCAASLIAVCVTREIRWEGGWGHLIGADRKIDGGGLSGESFSFNAAIQTGTSLRAQVQLAEQQSGPAQICELNALHFFAENALRLVSELEKGTASPDADLQSYGALKTCLQEIIRAKGSDPEKWLAGVKAALTRFDEAKGRAVNTPERSEVPK